MVFADGDGIAKLRYGGLRAWDAAGRSLSVSAGLLPDLESGQIRVVVDDSNASYPVTIDPLVTSEVSRLTASDAAEFGWFGHSVSISGDSVVVGGEYEGPGRT